VTPSQNQVIYRGFVSIAYILYSSNFAIVFNLLLCLSLITAPNHKIKRINPRCKHCFSIELKSSFKMSHFLSVQRTSKNVISLLETIQIYLGSFSISRVYRYEDSIHRNRKASITYVYRRYPRNGEQRAGGDLLNHDTSTHTLLDARATLSIGSFSLFP
jgi:hypothetical protein